MYCTLFKPVLSEYSADAKRGRERRERHALDDRWAGVTADMGRAVPLFDAAIRGCVDDSAVRPRRGGTWTLGSRTGST